MGTSGELFPSLYSLHGKTVPNSDSFIPIPNRRRSIPPFILPNIIQENPSLIFGDLYGSSRSPQMHTPGAWPISAAPQPPMALSLSSSLPWGTRTPSCCSPKCCCSTRAGHCSTAASVVLIKDFPSRCRWCISHTLATLMLALKSIIKAREDAMAFKKLRRC